MPKIPLGKASEVPSYNNYQKQAAVSVDATPESVVKPPISKIMELTSSQIETQNARRALILRLRCNGLNLENIARVLSDEYGHPVDVVTNDLLEMKKPDIFFKHKCLLQNSILEQIGARNTAIHKHIENNDNLGVNELVTIATQFECSPHSIIEEVQRYKSFRFQLTKMKQANRRHPRAQALLICLRISIRRAFYAF